MKISVKSSADLARWPAGVMNMVAQSLIEQVMRRKMKLMALSWDEHLAMNHTCPP